MARKIFFSFHYERDAWRASNVRNSDLISDEEETGFIDAADWEEIKKKGDTAIRKWIRDQMNGTTVTVVLIGAETSTRQWVNFEIRESWETGNAIVGLYIHSIKDQESKTDRQGSNPLDHIYLANGKSLSTVCKTYDWNVDEGRKNLGTWAENAASARAEYKGETKLKPDSKTDSVSEAAKFGNNSGPTIIRNPPSPWAR